MSRVGKKPIIIPAGVTVTVEPGRILVRGPKGELARRPAPEVKIETVDQLISVTVAHPEEDRERALWGTWAAHIRNMIQGVTQGFKKQLEVNGVGYRIAAQGAELKLEVGFSHPIIYQLPPTMQAKVEKNLITLESADVEALGKVAAAIRAIRPPEPYKGKGIKYHDEVIRRKAGKAVKAAAAG